MKPAAPIGVRLLRRRMISPWTGCWVFRGSDNGNGYRRITIGTKAAGDKRSVYVHRLAYEVWVGPIPEGMDIDHRCRNRACFRPDHLRPMSHRRNLLIGEGPSAINARKKSCVNGHPFTPENTRYRKRKHGSARVCVTCARACATASYARKKLRAAGPGAGDGAQHQQHDRHDQQDLQALDEEADAADEQGEDEQEQDERHGDLRVARLPLYAGERGGR